MVSPQPHNKMATASSIEQMLDPHRRVPSVMENMVRSQIVRCARFASVFSEVVRAHMKREQYRPFWRRITCWSDRVTSPSSRGGDADAAGGSVEDVVDRATVVQLPGAEQPVLAGACSVDLDRNNGRGSGTRSYKLHHVGGAAIYPGGVATTIYPDSASAPQQHRLLRRMSSEVLKSSPARPPGRRSASRVVAEAATTSARKEDPDLELDLTGQTESCEASPSPPPMAALSRTFTSASAVSIRPPASAIPDSSPLKWMNLNSAFVSSATAASQPSSQLFTRNEDKLNYPSAAALCVTPVEEARYAVNASSSLLSCVPTSSSARKFTAKISPVLSTSPWSQLSKPAGRKHNVRTALFAHDAPPPPPASSRSGSSTYNQLPNSAAYGLSAAIPSPTMKTSTSSLFFTSNYRTDLVLTAAPKILNSTSKSSTTTTSTSSGYGYLTSSSGGGPSLTSGGGKIQHADSGCSGASMKGSLLSSIRSGIVSTRPPFAPATRGALSGSAHKHAHTSTAPAPQPTITSQLSSHVERRPWEKPAR